MRPGYLSNYTFIPSRPKLKLNPGFGQTNAPADWNKTEYFKYVEPRAKLAAKLACPECRSDNEFLEKGSLENYKKELSKLSDEILQHSIEEFKKELPIDEAMAAQTLSAIGRMPAGNPHIKFQQAAYEFANNLAITKKKRIAEAEEKKVAEKNTTESYEAKLQAQQALIENLQKPKSFLARLLALFGLG